MNITPRLDHRLRPPAAAPHAAARILALDFIKGALVMVMVLYHWLNYFISPQGYFYRYLSFLPPSFICITGFLIARVYLFRPRDQSAKTSRRLAIRGLKILVLFIALNTAIGLLLHNSASGKGFAGLASAAAFWSIYITGNMDSGRMVAFYVLVPISYLLIFSACLLATRHCHIFLFYAAAALSIAAEFLLILLQRGSSNLDLLSIGLLGISIGALSLDKIIRLTERPFILVLAYLLYLAAISLWQVYYPLQIVGVLLTLLLLFLLGSACREDNSLARLLILLGRYSLFGYIAQIGLLQLMRKLLSVNLTLWELLASLLAAALLTVFSVIAIDRARSKSPLVYRFYAAVFS
jgi:peptidoglycan/LPS O-acetylase OafA/YrhL